MRMSAAKEMTSFSTRHWLLIIVVGVSQQAEWSSARTIRDTCIDFVIRRWELPAISAGVWSLAAALRYLLVKSLTGDDIGCVSWAVVTHRAACEHTHTHTDRQTQIKFIMMTNFHFFTVNISAENCRMETNVRESDKGCLTYQNAVQRGDVGRRQQWATYRWMRCGDWRIIRADLCIWQLYEKESYLSCSVQGTCMSIRVQWWEKVN